MNRKLFLSFAFAVGLVGFLGCTAQPPDEQEESKTAAEEQLETTSQSEVSSESFESGRVGVDADSQAQEVPEEGDAPEKVDPE